MSRCSGKSDCGYYMTVAGGCRDVGVAGGMQVSGRTSPTSMLGGKNHHTHDSWIHFAAHLVVKRPALAGTMKHYSERCGKEVREDELAEKEGEYLPLGRTYYYGDEEC